MRWLVAVTGVLLMGVGYFASQVAYFQGRAPVYAERVDTPAVSALAGLILLTALALAFIDKEPLAT